MGLTQIGGSIKQAQVNGVTFLDKLTNQYILKPTGMMTIGGSGFVFDYEAETKIELTSDITDHYCEDTNTIQDHQAIKPKRITLHGFVGELWMAAPTGLSGLIGSANSKLARVASYTGAYSMGVTQKIQGALNTAQQTADKINDYANRAGNLINMFSGAAAGPTRQAQAYQKLEALMLSKQIFVIEAPIALPYTQFKNMMIETLTFIQPEETKYVSDIVIALKEIRFATSKMSVASPSAMKGRAKPQNSANQDNGQSGGSSDSTSSKSNSSDSSWAYQAGHNNVKGWDNVPVAIYGE